MAFVLAGALAGSLAWAQPWHGIAGNDQLLSHDLLQALASLRPEYRECVWPTDEELQQHGVPLADVAPEAKDAAVGWIERTIKPEYVPDALAEHFVAFRRQFPFSPPEVVDYFAVRYEVGGYDVQVLETGFSVAVLFVPCAAPAATTDAREYLIDSARRFLQLPEDRIRSTEFEPKMVALGDNGQTHYGIIQYHDVEEDAARTWWHKVFSWTDGASMYFEFPELRGEETGFFSTPRDDFSRF